MIKKIQGMTDCILQQKISNVALGFTWLLSFSNFTCYYCTCCPVASVRYSGLQKSSASTRSETLQYSCCSPILR